MKFQNLFKLKGIFTKNLKILLCLNFFLKNFQNIIAEITKIEFLPFFTLIIKKFSFLLYTVYNYMHHPDGYVQDSGLMQYKDVIFQTIKQYELVLIQICSFLFEIPLLHIYFLAFLILKRLLILHLAKNLPNFYN